jgi:hypothetical protein
MKARFFWLVQNCKKFTIVFESESIIIGRDQKKRFNTFRKDTNLIAFSKREILDIRLAEFKLSDKNECDENKMFRVFPNPFVEFNGS